MPLAIFLVGVPGSGKTTFRNECLQGYSVVSLDDFIEHKAKEEGCDYNHAFSDYSSDAHHHSERMLRFFAQEGKDIVIDMTNLTKKSRLRKANLITASSAVRKDLEYNFLIIYFPTPHPIELEARLNSRPGKTIPKSVMNGMMESLEIPEEYMTPGYFVMLQQHFKKKDV